MNLFFHPCCFTSKTISGNPRTISFVNMNRIYNNALCGVCISITIFSILFSSFSFAAETKNSKQVVFIRYNLKDSSSPPSAALDAFKKTMEERGYQEGKNIDYIDHVTRYPERKSAEEVLNIVEKYRTTADMFITSSWTSLYVRSKLAKSNVPQLFVPALESSALDMLPSITTEPNTNLSGVYLTYQPEKILQLAKSIFPLVTKYGFVYDSRIPVDRTFKAAFGQLNVHERHGITISYFDLANGPDTVLQKINKMDMEVFGGVTGALKNLPVLSKSNLPMITVLLFDRDDNSLADTIEKSTIVAGLYHPFWYCGKQAAEMTADIFDGKSTIEETVPRPAKQVTIINLDAIKRLNISVPSSVLEAAGLVIE